MSPASAFIAVLWLLVASVMYNCGGTLEFLLSRPESLLAIGDPSYFRSTDFTLPGSDSNY